MSDTASTNKGGEIHSDLIQYHPYGAVGRNLQVSRPCRKVHDAAEKRNLKGRDHHQFRIWPVRKIAQKSGTCLSDLTGQYQSQTRDKQMPTSSRPLVAYRGNMRHPISPP